MEIFVGPTYRPLVTLAYKLEYKLFGLSAGGYHTVNLLLHLANVLLVWKVSKKFGFTQISRGLLTLLFGLHPGQVASVCFISCHGDLLATFFCLLAFYFWMSRARTRYFGIFFVLLAMLCKEAAILFPVAMMLYDWMILGKLILNLRSYLPAVAWIFYFALRLHGLKHADGLESHASILFSMGSLRTFLYLGRMLFPFPMAPDGDLPNLSNVQKILYHFVFLAVIVVVFVKSKQKPLLRFMFIWLFLAMFPIADWFNFNLRFSDQLLYYPLLPFCLLTGLLADQPRKVWGFAIVLVTFAAISFVQIQYWRDVRIFWGYALEKNPLSPVYALNYSVALIGEGQKEDGCKVMQYAWKISQVKYNPVHYNLILSKLGFCNADVNPALAIEYYKKSLMVRNNDLATRMELILLLMRQGQHQQAAENAKILLVLDPNNEEFRRIYADALVAKANKPSRTN